jgi:thiaminase
MLTLLSLYSLHKVCTATRIPKSDNHRYVLDIGQSEDWFALQMVLLPCLLGYGLIGTRLFNHPDTLREANRYWKWIQTYAADDFQEAVRMGRGLSALFQSRYLTIYRSYREARC